MDADQSEWELCKENVQPLKQGRSFLQLSAALRHSDDIKQQQDFFEMELRTYSGDDPLSVWVSYINWTEQNFPKGGKDGNTHILLRNCVIQFKDDIRYHSDPRYIKMWIKFANFNTEPGELYTYLFNNKIGCQVAELYDAWAHFLESSGNSTKADAVYCKGIELGAQPLDFLVKRHCEFQARVARRLAESRSAEEDLGTSGGQLIPGASEAAQRAALGRLRSQGRSRQAPVNRISSRSAPPLQEQRAVPQTLGPSIPVYNDENAPSMLPPQNLEYASVPTASSLARENQMKAGKWSNVKLKQKASHPSSTQSDFVYHEDQEIHQPSVVPHAVADGTGILSTHHEDYDGNSALAMLKGSRTDKKDVQEVPMYCKHKIYAGSKELSFEELRAARWFQKHREEEKLKEELREQLKAEMQLRLEAERKIMQDELMNMVSARLASSQSSQLGPSSGDTWNASSNVSQNASAGTTQENKSVATSSNAENSLPVVPLLSNLSIREGSGRQPTESTRSSNDLSERGGQVPVVQQNKKELSLQNPLPDSDNVFDPTQDQCNLSVHPSGNIADSSQTVHTKDAFRQVYSWFRSTSMMAEPGGSSLVSAVNIDTDYDGRLLILPKDDEEFAATPPSPSSGKSKMSALSFPIFAEPSPVKEKKTTFMIFEDTTLNKDPGCRKQDIKEGIQAVQPFTIYKEQSAVNKDQNHSTKTQNDKDASCNARPFAIYEDQAAGSNKNRDFSLPMGIAINKENKGLLFTVYEDDSSHPKERSKSTADQSAGSLSIARSGSGSLPIPSHNSTGAGSLKPFVVFEDKPAEQPREDSLFKTPSGIKLKTNPIQDLAATHFSNNVKRQPIVDKENLGTPMETGSIQTSGEAEMSCAAEQIATSSNVANRTAALPAKLNEFYDDIEMKTSGQAWVEPQDDIVFEPYSTSTQDHTNFVRSAMMTGKLGGVAMHSDSTSAGSTNQNTSSWATNQRPRKSMTFIDHGLVSHLDTIQECSDESKSKSSSIDSHGSSGQSCTGLSTLRKPHTSALLHYSRSTSDSAVKQISYQNEFNDPSSPVRPGLVPFRMEVDNCDEECKPEGKQFAIHEDSIIMSEEKGGARADPMDQSMMDQEEGGANNLNKSVMVDHTNPFSVELIRKFLLNLDPPLTTYENCHQMAGCLPRFVVRSKITLGNEEYLIQAKLGEGGFAKVYYVEREGFKKHSGFVVKIQKPACPWEFYITRELHRRLSELKSHIDIRPSIMYINEAYFFEDGSLFFNERHQLGTLLDLVNLTKLKSLELPEWFVLLLVVELFNTVEHMHRCHMIHGDLKPDNILITELRILNKNEDIPDLLSGKSSFLKLIDFGQSIDMTMFPPGTTFMSTVATQDFQCVEMKMGRPWSYQIDIFGLVATVAVLLTGSYKYLIQNSITNKWTMSVTFKRSWKSRDLLKQMIGDLLNIPSSSQLPDLGFYREAMQSTVLESVDRDGYNAYMHHLQQVYADARPVQ